MKKLVIHRVGNKAREEGYLIAPSECRIYDGNVEELLLRYFLSSFKEKALYKFHHETDIHLNEIYMCASSIFIDPQSFYEQSVNIVKHLYDKSAHPQVKAGEFYVAYFSDCILQDTRVDAIGIFKTENKENYLKITHHGNDFMIDADKGINIKKLDKGCIIFNIDSVEGYRLAVVDNTNKGNSEALYWKEEFLRVTDLQDEHFQTRNYLNLCQDFVENIYGPVHNADKKDQVLFINDAISYFDSHQEFKLDEFVDHVIEQPELAEQFKEHKRVYDENQGIRHKENFEISAPAVKTMKRKFKNQIKLDTDIEIKLKAVPEQGEMEFIERGYDEMKGMHFYKVYFNEEE
jgi:hypothetical protein